MSGKKISQLTKITSVEDLSGSDLVLMVDVSDLSMGPGGTNKAATMTALIGPMLEVTPGVIQANKALIADSNSKIAGVGSSELQRLNVTAGSWQDNKALVVDSGGKINEVTSTQFSALNVTAGNWQNNKALVVDSTGRVAGVLQNQFSTLDVNPGTITASKAAVWDSSVQIASSTLTINAGSSAQVLVKNGSVSQVLISQSGITVSGTGAPTLSINGSVGFEIVLGGFPTRLQHNLLTMATTTHESSLRSSFIRFDYGSSYSQLGPTSLYMDTSNLDINLKGLPTSDVGLPVGRVYVDQYGYLKIKV